MVVDKGQLRRLMPRDADDVESARALMALGYPVLEPVLADMLRRLKDHNSPVADIFCEFFASLGAPAAHEIGRVLMSSRMPDLRHQLVSRVLPRWPREALAQVSAPLQMLVTHSDAFDTDLRCIRLLAQHQLADRQWLQDWLRFKCERMERHLAFARELVAEIGA